MKSIKKICFIILIMAVAFANTSFCFAEGEDKFSLGGVISKGQAYISSAGRRRSMGCWENSGYC